MANPGNVISKLEAESTTAKCPLSRSRPSRIEATLNNSDFMQNLQTFVLVLRNFVQIFAAFYRCFARYRGVSNEVPYTFGKFSIFPK